MTTLREKIDIMQAYEDGQQIQTKPLANGEWEDNKLPVWNWMDFDYRIKPKVLPNTWKEFCEQNPKTSGECFINNTSNITVVETELDSIRHSNVDANLIKTHKLAESFIALMKLIQLRDCYNDGWQPDWIGTDTTKYTIYIYQDAILPSTDKFTHRILAFKSYELRDLFLKNFEDLIEIAKPLL